MEHQSIGGYRNNTAQPLAQMKPANNGTDPDKVIFKIESDHLTNNQPSFRHNNSTNYSMSNINNQEIKQFKILNNNMNGQINPIQNQVAKNPPPIDRVKVEPAELKKAESATLPNSLNIYVNNVVCSYSTRCHLNLRRIAMEGMHVEYKKENGMVNMKLRKPYTTSTMWSSGKVTCAGAKSENDAYIAARRFCRLLQKMQFKVKMTNYRVVNVLATCNMPFGIDIQKLAETHQKECSYEPELHPGATYKLIKIKATLKLFTTGSITLTAPSVMLAQEAINQIYPILLEFKRSFPDQSSQAVVKANNEKFVSTQMQRQIPAKMMCQNFTTMVKQESKPQIISENFSNFNYYNNIQSNQKHITKTISSNLTPVSSLDNNNLANLNNSLVPTKSNITLKNNDQTTSPNQVYQLNLPQTYHQIIPSSSLSSYNPTPVTPTSTSSSNNPVYMSSLGTSNSSSSILNHQHNLVTPLHANSFTLNTPIISSSSFQGVGGSSQPSSGWYYDSLAVDNVDDFLP